MNAFISVQESLAIVESGIALATNCLNQVKLQVCLLLAFHCLVSSQTEYQRNVQRWVGYVRCRIGQPLTILICPSHIKVGFYPFYGKAPPFASLFLFSKNIQFSANFDTFSYYKPEDFCTTVDNMSFGKIYALEFQISQWEGKY